MVVLWSWRNKSSVESSLWCLSNVAYQFLEILTHTRTLFGFLRLSIFTNFNFSTCRIFKYRVSIKGILITLWVREVYSCRKSMKLALCIDSVKLHLIYRYGFPNLPPLAYLDLPLIRFSRLSQPPTIWNLRLLGTVE